MALFHWNVKNTIIMFQCKTYLNTCFVWIIMLVRLLIKVYMFSFSAIMDWKKKKTIFFDIKCNNSYLMKCLHNNISKNDAICWHLSWTHLISNIKTTSSILIHTEEKPYDKSVHTREEPHIYDFLIVKLINNIKWVWSGNTTITNCRQPRGTVRKSRSTITRHQEDKLSKAISSLFPIKMIAILKWT